jgi:hypothetical protein
VPAAGGAPQTLTAHEGYYLIRSSRLTARVAFSPAPLLISLYAIMLTPPPDHDGDSPAEIGGIDPPNTLEIRTMPAAGGAQTLVASAQGGRGLHFARGDNDRVYFRTNRGLASITLAGFDRRTVVRVQGVGPGNNPPAADEIRLSPDGTKVFVSLQGRHHLFSLPRAGRDTVEVRITGRGDNTAVPVTRMSAEGGDYLTGRATAPRWCGPSARRCSGRPSAAPNRSASTWWWKRHAPGPRAPCCSPADASSP